LRAELEEQRIDFGRDWESITNEEGAEKLRDIEGSLDRSMGVCPWPPPPFVSSSERECASSGGRGGLHALDEGYVLTVDNLLKMISIQLRLKFNLPVIIMGETGCALYSGRAGQRSSDAGASARCGKSSLIRNLCAILGFPLHTLNVHGGMTDEDIITWMEQRIATARNMDQSADKLVVFFDEVNTCNSMGLFKEIVCDRCMNGTPIPQNIKIIAACNPYRLRTTKSLYGGEEMAGLVYEHHGATHSENVGTGIKDPLRNLVYRVHPLPGASSFVLFCRVTLTCALLSLSFKRA
jgi:hypothetical protein